MWADEEIALIIVLANLISAVWSYFSIVCSVDPNSSGYNFMHQELAWVTHFSRSQNFSFELLMLCLVRSLVFMPNLRLPRLTHKYRIGSVYCFAG
jgi:hypothetical protein